MAVVELIVMFPGGLRNSVIIQNFWRLVAQHQITVVGSVPTELGAVLQNPPGDNNISTIRTGFTGAALLPSTIGECFEQITNCLLHERLGMTETSGLVRLDPLRGFGSKGSVGWALPYTKVEILRLNDDGTLGDRCDVEEIGVITIQGDHVTPGYCDPKHNEGVFCKGRLNSGDFRHKVSKGTLYAAGCSKDLIIRGGHNIDPAIIENAMATHPAVALGAAVGAPDAYAGELPVCFVELLPNMQIDFEDLHHHD